MVEARELYTQRLAAREGEAARLKRIERQLSIARLALIVVAIVAAVVDFGWIVAAPVALFFALVFLHDRIIRRRTREEAAATFYRRGLERLDGQWAGNGLTGTQFETEHHPFAADLDLFGRASLFELLCLAVTAPGQAMLASWLTTPDVTVSGVKARQDAVRELREEVDFRESMSIAARQSAEEIEGADAAGWSGRPAVEFATWERVGALALPLVTVGALIATLPALTARLIGTTHPESGLSGGAGPVGLLIVALALQMLLASRMSGRVAEIVMGVERAEPALAQLQQLLLLVEAREFRSERLRAIGAAVRKESGRASADIDRLRRLVSLLDARRNQFFAPIGLLLLWTTNLAARIEAWRRGSGHSIAEWIDAVAEIETLSSLASFSFENPSYAFPELVEGRHFEAADLGHPLIRADRRVGNDVTLGEDMRLLVISGSNMSGKSTLLRSVGTACVLSFAGAPVCARSLRVSPVAIGASIRINDSLQEGASRFYAEILRIRQILQLASGGQPLLFLLDEILHGTNSHDRRIGAEAVVRRLVADGAIGLVSTHDLALAQIAESLAPAAANVHFEDHLEGDKMVFDYRMRPGVVEKSNALALMRSVGIEV